MTRNEVDVLRLNIVHHLQTSCDRIIVFDNASTDKSRSVLKRLASKLPIDWTTGDGTRGQDDVVTEMLHEARAKGADWVIPLDTDEFWHSGRKLHEILAEDDESGAIEVSRIEFIQARDQERSNARGVLRATMRFAEPLRGSDAIDDFLDGKRSMFETEPQPKVLIRATADVSVPVGAHTASGLSGPKSVASEIVIFHLPLRSRRAVFARAEQARLFTTLSDDPYGFAQVRYWQRMALEDRISEAWKAHSYEDGAIEVGGRRVDLIEDGRLVELLAPWVRSARSQAIARFTGRSW